MLSTLSVPHPRAAAGARSRSELCATLLAAAPHTHPHLVVHRRFKVVENQDEDEKVVNCTRKCVRARCRVGCVLPTVAAAPLAPTPLPDNACSSKYPAKYSCPFCAPSSAQTPAPKTTAPATVNAALSARSSATGSTTCEGRRARGVRRDCHLALRAQTRGGQSPRPPLRPPCLQLLNLAQLLGLFLADRAQRAEVAGSAAAAGSRIISAGQRPVLLLSGGNPPAVLSLLLLLLLAALHSTKRRGGGGGGGGGGSQRAPPRRSVLLAAGVQVKAPTAVCRRTGQPASQPADAHACKHAGRQASTLEERSHRQRRAHRPQRARAASRAACRVGAADGGPPASRTRHHHRHAQLGPWSSAAAAPARHRRLAGRRAAGLHPRPRVAATNQLDTRGARSGWRAQRSGGGEAPIAGRHARACAVRMPVLLQLPGCWTRAVIREGGGGTRLRSSTPRTRRSAAAPPASVRSLGCPTPSPPPPSTTPASQPGHARQFTQRPGGSPCPLRRRARLPPRRPPPCPAPPAAAPARAAATEPLDGGLCAPRPLGAGERDGCASCLRAPPLPPQPRTSPA